MQRFLSTTRSRGALNRFGRFVAKHALLIAVVISAVWAAIVSRSEFLVAAASLMFGEFLGRHGRERSLPAGDEGVAPSTEDAPGMQRTVQRSGSGADRADLDVRVISVLLGVGGAVGGWLLVRRLRPHDVLALVAVIALVVVLAQIAKEVIPSPDRETA